MSRGSGAAGAELRRSLRHSGDSVRSWRGQALSTSARVRTSSWTWLAASFRGERMPTYASCGWEVRAWRWSSSEPMCVRPGCRTRCSSSANELTPRTVSTCSTWSCCLRVEDPFPLVMLEAAALATPTVCFLGNGGAPEFVEEDAGICVPSGNVEALAAGSRGSALQRGPSPNAGALEREEGHRTPRRQRGSVPGPFGHPVHRSKAPLRALNKIEPGYWDGAATGLQGRFEWLQLSCPVRREFRGWDGMMITLRRRHLAVLLSRGVPDAGCRPAARSACLGRSLRGRMCNHS